MSGPDKNTGISRRPRRMHPLVELSVTRVKEFYREPEAIFWVFVFPVLLALALGIAFRNKPPDTFVVIVESSMEDPALVEDMLSGNTALKPVTMGREKAMEKLAAGNADIMVSELTDGGTEGMPAFELLYDHSRDPSRVAALLASDMIQRGTGRKDTAVIRARDMTQKGSRYIDFLIPGLIGMNLLSSGMWGVGFNIVQSRTKKLLKRMVATPMKRSHFLMSFILSRLLFLYIEVAFLISFGWIIFDVKVRGSILAVALLALVGAFTFAGLGLLVASRSRSIEAVSGWINFVMLPMYVLSGGFFSYERFPEVFHPFIRLLPLTAMLDALRAIMNEGASIFSQYQELGVLALWCLVCFSIALRVFRWQ